MPGRLIMDEQNSAVGSQDLKKDRNYVQEGGAVQRAPSAGNVAQPQPNGPAANGPNGALSNGVAHNTGANGQSQTSDASGPPPLDQSWREDVGNKKLGLMLDRLAQQCFSEVNGVVDQMSAIPLSQDVQKVNGNASLPTEDKDEASLAKKKMLLGFAHEQRDRFTRALIISDWSASAGDLESVIDLNLQLQKTEHYHAEATRRVGQIRLDMQQAKMPNPNLEGALEFLGTGKSQAYPDIGYLPPTKLSAQQLLRTLKEMNVQISERLMLHQELPYHLQDYSVANGRATFKVAGEFEVDLSVADYEPTSSWFFIDIRMLFHPSPGKVDAGLHSHFEQLVNSAIASKGLQGCYEVLHDFVLTHKINTLYSQAADMSRGKWIDCLRVQRVRRILTVEYWRGRSGKKSWLEFGIASGKTKILSPARQTPVITVRWFRRNAEVEKHDLDFDWQTLDLEKMLMQTITKHVSLSLTYIRDGMQTLAASAVGFSTDLQTSVDEPNDCLLDVKLPSLSAPIRLWTEPITGKYAITPSSAITASTQHRLNADPDVDIPRAFASMLCSLSLERVERAASTLGWLRIRHLARQDNLAALFGSDFWQRRVYRPSVQWGDQWAIAATVGLGGNKWWIVRLTTPNAPERTMTTAHELRIKADSDILVSRELLLRVERMAVAEVSFAALVEQLDAHQIPYRVERQRALTSSDDSKRRLSETALYLGFNQLMNPTKDPKQKSWAQELVRVTHHGADNRSHDRYCTDLLSIKHDIRLTLQPGFLKALQQHRLKTRDTDVIMNETGGLALRLRTTFGVPFVDQLRKRLISIARLDNYLTVLRRFRVRCDEASLSRLAFTYSSNPALSAHLTFADDGNRPVQLRLEPADSNPHHRARIFFEQMLNTGQQEVFSCFVGMLLSTLHFYQAIESLELRHPSKQLVFMHIRTAFWYTLRYKAPCPQVTFTIRVRTVREGSKQLLKWHVEQERTKANADSLPEALVTALRELWNSNTGQHEGLGNGLVTTGRDIGTALEKIDGIVRRFESGAAGSQAQAPAVQQQQHQSKQPQPPTKQAQAPKQATKQEREVIALD